MTPKAVDCLIESVAEKALIRKRIHSHVMRHTFATTLLDNGNDLRTVQALMGHKTVAMTSRYSHHSVDSLKPLVEQLISVSILEPTDGFEPPTR